MSFSYLEKITTKVGIISLAALAVIGVIASFGCAFKINFDIFSGTILESIYFFLLLVLSIVASFCIPASILINFSSIAISLKKKKDEVR